MKTLLVLITMSIVMLTGCDQSPLTEQILPSITPTPSPIVFARPTVAPKPQLQLPDNLNLEDLDLAQPENYDLEIDPINLQNTQNLDTLQVALTPNNN